MTFIASPADDFAKAVVVEICPRLRSIHPTWNIANLRMYAKARTQVRMYGWLMFDGEHPELVVDPTKPDKDRVRRATLWEIHPNTRIEVKIGGKWLTL